MCLLDCVLFLRMFVGTKMDKIGCLFLLYKLEINFVMTVFFYNLIHVLCLSFHPTIPAFGGLKVLKLKKN